LPLFFQFSTIYDMSIQFTEKEKIRSLFWQKKDYRDFLIAVHEMPDSVLRNKSQIAHLLGVSAPYMTKVFSKQGHLSLEQAEALGCYLGFSEEETYAFINKILHTRATSDNLKRLIEKKIGVGHELSHRPETIKNNSHSVKLAPPPNLLFYRIAAFISNARGATLSELCKKFGMSQNRLHYLLERLEKYFPLTVSGVGEMKLYRVDLKTYSYQPREPGSQSMYELGMGLRRLATYSLETRYPIHLVDEGEHYVSGSYVIPMDEDQIKLLAIHFSQLAKKITETAASSPVGDNAKFVAISFDLFDANL
jgi:hypothetical protein